MHTFEEILQGRRPNKTQVDFLQLPGQVRKNLLTRKHPNLTSQVEQLQKSSCCRPTLPSTNDGAQSSSLQPTTRKSERRESLKNPLQVTSLEDQKDNWYPQSERLPPSVSESVFGAINLPSQNKPCLSQPQLLASLKPHSALTHPSTLIRHKDLNTTQGQFGTL